MSKREKLLKKLFNKPKGFKWSEMQTLLGLLGFEKINPKRKKGSRRCFYNSELQCQIHLHEPHPENTVDAGAIADVVSTLENYGIMP